MAVRIDRPNDPFGAPITRQQLLKTAAAAGLAYAAADTHAVAHAAPTKGGTAVFGIKGGTDPHNFIPIAYWGSIAFETCKLMYTPLILLDSTWTNMTPGLATSWSWSSDGRHLTMKLRKGVKFHDGSDFSAKDVDFTYKLMVRRESAPAVIDVTILEGAADYLNKKTETFAGLDVLDDYTVRFNLSAPSSTFLINVSNTGILPAHAFPSDVLAKNFNDENIEKIPFFQTHPIGTGPFMFKDWDVNTHTSLTAFSQYWKGAPLLDGIDMLYNYTDSSLTSGLLSGQLDSAYIDEQTARALMHASNLHLNIGPGLANETDLFVACEKPYMNVPVRQALRSAIDLPTLIKTVLYGLARPAPSMMMYPALFPNPALPQFNYDPARAKQLLKEGNWDPSRTMVFGVETTLTSPDNSTLAIMNMWQNVGVRTSFKPIDPANAQNILLAKQHSYDLVILQYAWLAYNPSTTFAEFSSAAANTGSNFTNYHNAAYDSTMAKAIRTADPQQANRLFQKAQVILGTDLPSIPLWMEDEIWAISNRLHGGVLHRGPLNDIGAQLWWKA